MIAASVFAGDSWAILDLLGPVAKVTGALAGHPGPVPSLPLLWAPLRTGGFGAHSVNTFKWQNHCLWNLKTLSILSFLLVVGGVRCNHLPFTLEALPRYSPDHWTPRNFSEVEVPKTWIDIISYTLTNKCPPNKSRVEATFCSLALLSTEWPM